MSRLVTVHDPTRMTSEAFEAVLRPRDDIVGETQVADDTFELRHGPFSSYERRLEHRDGKVIERIDYRLAIPWFAWAFALLVRRALRHHRSGPSQPWWAPGQRLDARASTVMGNLAAAALLGGFLANTLSEVLTFAADEFDLSRTDQGVASAVVRIGPILAIGLVTIADRRGRRRIAILATVGGCLASLLAAAAPSAELFVACQVVMRTFGAALATTVLVYAVEEMPAGARAYALSVLGMASALGAGMVLWVLPLADVGERSWRLVLLVPIVLLPLGWSFRKHLPESRWFDPEAERPPLRDHRSKLAGLMLLSFVFQIYLSPIDQFRSEYLRDERGFEAWQITLFVTTTVTPGGLGLLIAGRMADAFGRKRIIVAATAIGLGCLTLFFNTAGVAMWFLALTAAVVSSGLLPALGVYRGELFPTRIRTQAAGWVTLAGVSGSITGLLAVGWLGDRWDSLGSVIAVAWIGPLFGALFAWWWLPETTGRRLDELNPDDHTSV